MSLCARVTLSVILYFIDSSLILHTCDNQNVVLLKVLFCFWCFYIGIIGLVLKSLSSYILITIDTLSSPLSMEHNITSDAENPKFLNRVFYQILSFHYFSRPPPGYVSARVVVHGSCAPKNGQQMAFAGKVVFRRHFHEFAGRFGHTVTSGFHNWVTRLG